MMQMLADGRCCQRGPSFPLLGAMGMRRVRHSARMKHKSARYQSIGCPQSNGAAATAARDGRQALPGDNRNHGLGGDGGGAFRSAFCR
jgi:hypothetical protein